MSDENKIMTEEGVTSEEKVLEEEVREETNEYEEDAAIEAADTEEVPEAQALMPRLKLSAKNYDKAFREFGQHPHTEEEIEASPFTTEHKEELSRQRQFHIYCCRRIAQIIDDPVMTDFDGVHMKQGLEDIRPKFLQLEGTAEFEDMISRSHVNEDCSINKLAHSSISELMALAGNSLSPFLCLNAPVPDFRRTAISLAVSGEKAFPGFNTGLILTPGQLDILASIPARESWRIGRLCCKLVLSWCTAVPETELNAALDSVPSHEMSPLPESPVSTGSPSFVRLCERYWAGARDIAQKEPGYAALVYGLPLSFAERIGRTPSDILIKFARFTPQRFRLRTHAATLRALQNIRETLVENTSQARRSYEAPEHLLLRIMLNAQAVQSCLLDMAVKGTITNPIAHKVGERFNAVKGLEKEWFNVVPSEAESRAAYAKGRCDASEANVKTMNAYRLNPDGITQMMAMSGLAMSQIRGELESEGEKRTISRKVANSPFFKTYDGRVAQRNQTTIERNVAVDLSVFKAFYLSMYLAMTQHKSREAVNILANYTVYSIFNTKEFCHYFGMNPEARPLGIELWMSARKLVEGRVRAVRCPGCGLYHFVLDKGEPPADKIGPKGKVLAKPYDEPFGYDGCPWCAAAIDRKLFSKVGSAFAGEGPASAIRSHELLQKDRGFYARARPIK